MKKFYALFVVCLFLAAYGYGQSTITWSGGSSGNWNTGSNWTGGVVPGGLDSVVFTSSAAVDLDLDVIEVKSLTITSGATVKLVAIKITGNVMSVTNPLYPALRIDAGSRLIDSVYGGGLNNYFDFKLAENAGAEISGALVFTGSDDSQGSMLWLDEFDPGTVNVNSGGSMVIGENGYSPTTYSGKEAFFVFKNGSLLHFAGASAQGGSDLPNATFEPASTVMISALQTGGIAFNTIDEIGNLTYAFPEQSAAVNLGIPAGVIIKGDLHISNTNNQKLVLLANPSNSIAVPVIEGNLVIEGNSVIEVSEANPGKIINLTVKGDANIGGTAFSLQGSNNSSPTTLILQGNLNHTAGTFGASSTATSGSVHLYTVEMNGNAPQTISSHNGSIDNAANQVTLRLNNAAGVTLNSPLEVGRLSFNSVGKGKLFTTSANVLAINNISENAIVVESPDNAGFVSGPVRRKTITDNPLSIPTGKGSVYRPATIVPTSEDGITVTTYEATYFNTAHASIDQFDHPVLGVSDAEYWEVQRIGAGADAKVELSLNGAVNGASMVHYIIATKFNGAKWVTARPDGGLYLPGDATTGTVSTSVQTSFGYYSFGYVLQSALPTTLANFTARKTAEGEAVLSWKITDISTPESFEVTRSSDGVNFTTIGKVSGSANKRDYTFTDRQLLTGNNHYRLRMLDQDGAVTYSIVATVINGVKGVVLSAPMPSIVADRTRMTVSASVQGRMQLVVTDTYGRVMQQQTAEISKGAQEIWLNATRLASGIYQVTGYMNGEKTSTFRFIKK